MIKSKYKTTISFFTIIVILSLFCCVNICNANFENKINNIEKEIQKNERKVIVTDEIENEARETIFETCNGKNVCSNYNSVDEAEIPSEENIEADGTIEQENISYDGDIRGNGLHLLGAYQGLTYYSQADSRWANMPYTSIGDANQTMKSSGCGPTVAAIVVSSSKGAILPTTMAHLFVSNGYRTVSNGTAWSAFPFVADYFGFNSYEYTSNLNTAIEYLRRGYFVIVSCGNGLFTTNGHYIVLVRNKWGYFVYI